MDAKDSTTPIPPAHRRNPTNGCIGVVDPRPSIGGGQKAARYQVEAEAEALTNGAPMLLKINEYLDRVATEESVIHQGFVYAKTGQI